MAMTDWREDRYRLLEHGETVEVGDVIVGTHMLGHNRHKVHRVTKRFAVVWFNDTTEGRYPRVFSDYGFQSLPRDRYCTTRYRVHRLK